MKYSLSNSLLYILIFFFARGAGQYLKYNSTGWSGWQLSYLYISLSIIFGPIIIQIVLRRTGAWLRRTGAWYFIKVYGALVFRSPTLFFKPLTSFCCSAVLLLCFFVCLFVFLLFSLLLLLLLCLYTSLLLCFSAFVPFALLAFCFSCFFVLHASLLDLLLFFSASLLFCLCLSTSTSTIPPFLFISHAFLQFYFLYPHCKLIKLLYTGMIANW